MLIGQTTSKASYINSRSLLGESASGFFFVLDAPALKPNSLSLDVVLDQLRLLPTPLVNTNFIVP